MFKFFKRFFDFIRRKIISRKIRKSDFVSLALFQKWQEMNPIESDISFLEHLYEVF